MIIQEASYHKKQTMNKEEASFFFPIIQEASYRKKQIMKNEEVSFLFDEDASWVYLCCKPIIHLINFFDHRLVQAPLLDQTHCVPIWLGFSLDFVCANMAWVFT